MTDFLALDHQTRTYALVGSFLQAWSLMEAALNRTIASALSLNFVIEVILCNNIQFHDKINVLKTLVSISPLSETEKVRLDSILGKLGLYSKYRNMIAHAPLVSSETNDGVQFIVIRARGSLKFPAGDWSVARFEEAYQTIGDFADELEALQKNLKVSMTAMKEWALSDSMSNPLAL